MGREATTRVRAEHEILGDTESLVGSNRAVCDRLRSSHGQPREARLIGDLDCRLLQLSSSSSALNEEIAAVARPVRQVKMQAL